MEKAYIQRCKNLNMICETFPTWEYDYAEDFEFQFTPLSEVLAIDTYFVDPHCVRDPFGMKTKMIKTK